MTDEDLGRVAATTLKARFPEPAEVDLLDGLHAPAAGRQRITIMAAAASVLVVAGVSAGLALTSGSTHPGPVPSLASPPQGTTHTVTPPVSPPCTPNAADITVRLGGARLRGNLHPVHARVPVGHVVRVVARFGTRELTMPATSSSALQVICTTRRHHAASTYYRAARPGTATVTSRTSDCGPCMQTQFAARIHVVPHTTRPHSASS